VRAAVLHGPDDLRIEDVEEPRGEVIVAVDAATACDHRPQDAPATGTACSAPIRRASATRPRACRTDTGERVLVGDSVACGTCAACTAGRPQLCAAMTWVLGGFAERIAAPAGALHAIPDGLEAAGAAMAEPLSRRDPRGPARRGRRGGHPRGRRRPRRRHDGPDARAAARARRARRHARRPPPRSGARRRPRSARARCSGWIATSSSSRPSGARGVARGDRRGCPGRHRRARRRLPRRRRRGASGGAAALRRARRARRLPPTRAPRSTRRSSSSPAAPSTGAPFARDTVGLDELHDALLRPTVGPARKLVVATRAAEMAELRTAHTADLDRATLGAAHALLFEVFEGEFDDHDWEHSLGGIHALIWEDGDGHRPCGGGPSAGCCTAGAR